MKACDIGWKTASPGKIDGCNVSFRVVGQQMKVAAVGVNPISLLARRFLQYLGVLQRGDRLRGRGLGLFQDLHHPGQGDDWLLGQGIEQADRRNRGAGCMEEAFPGRVPPIQF